MGNQTDFGIPHVKSVNYGIESIRVLRSKICGVKIINVGSW